MAKNNSVKLIDQHIIPDTKFKKGMTPWNKGMKGIHFSPKTEFKKGLIPWMTGKHHTKKTKELIRQKNKGHQLTEDQHKKLLGRIPWNRGKVGLQKHDDAWKLNMSIKMRGKKRPDVTGVNHPNWNSGSRKQKYPMKFGRISRWIKKRDNFKCRECGCPESECIYWLHVHHIDYDKNNCDFNNLITLCPACHNKTNKASERPMWTIYYEGKMKLIASVLGAGAT